MNDKGRVSLEAALQAQAAMRASAGLPKETFPVADFVGMVSDEIEQLRKIGRSDEQIAELITASSPIQITGPAISKYYAPPELRPHRDAD